MTKSWFLVLVFGVCWCTALGRENLTKPAKFEKTQDIDDWETRNGIDNLGDLRNVRNLEKHGDVENLKDLDGIANAIDYSNLKKLKDSGDDWKITLIEPLEHIDHQLQRANVAAPSCSKAPRTTLLQPGDISWFASPNYPNNYSPYENCAWKFQVPTNAILRLTCNPVVLDWFTKMILTDGQSSPIHHGCLFCPTSGPFTYNFDSTDVEVAISNGFFFSSSGFLCIMEAVALPACYCGISGNTRIVGGTITAENDYHWVAGLFNKGNTYPNCGATLITAEFALTAAHCTEGRNPADFEIKFGIHDLAHQPVTAITRDVKEFIDHPSYDSAAVNFDASLLRFDALVFSTTKVRPICLPSTTNILDYVGYSSTVTGWGAVQDNGFPSLVLLEVHLPVIANSVCQAILVNKTITENMICAGGNVGQDSCQGDSGGGLWITPIGSGGHKELIGVVSFGDGCGVAGRPGVYTRITAIQSWIQTVIAASQKCATP